MMKGYKIRIYPTKDQEQLMWKHINCSRYIWNYMLAEQKRRYQSGEKHLSHFDMCKLLTPLKKDGEHDWLYEVSNATLQRVCGDLNEAYQRMFEKTSRKPKFKSKKKSNDSFPVRNEHIMFDGKYVGLPKMKKVKYKTDFVLPLNKSGCFYNPRVSYKNKKWFLSFAMECENQAPMLTDNRMGIDLGVKDLAIVSCENEAFKFTNINKSSKMRTLNKKVKHIQRSISRKYEANKVGRKFVKTNNIVKLEDEFRRLCAKRANIRNNYIHQTTHKLISMLPCRVTMEDLNISGMLKNRHLSKAISEQCFYEFIRQMRYKCEWNNIEFVQVGRFYPSSKTCSCCGTMKSKLKLSERVFKCEACGAVIDRDVNASINLMRYVA